MGSSSPAHNVATLPPEAPAPTPADLLRAVDRLGAALEAHSARVDQRFSEIGEVLDAQKSAIARANDNAQRALQASSETKLAAAETQKAMIVHAATVADASKSIVESNAEQTPILIQTAAALAKIKGYLPLAIAGAIAAGTVLGNFWHALMQALSH